MEWGDTQLWVTILAGAIGYLVNPPRVKERKEKILDQEDINMPMSRDIRTPYIPSAHARNEDSARSDQSPV